MANAQDIAARLLTSTLRMGLAPEAHADEIAAWINSESFNDDEGCPFDEAVATVAAIVNETARDFLSDVVFATACRVPGSAGRTLGLCAAAHLGA